MREDTKIYVETYLKKKDEYKEGEDWGKFSLDFKLMEWVGYYLYEYKSDPCGQLAYDTQQMNIPYHMSVKVSPVLSILSN